MYMYIVYTHVCLICVQYVHVHVLYVNKKSPHSTVINHAVFAFHTTVVQQ